MNSPLRYPRDSHRPELLATSFSWPRHMVWLDAHCIACTTITYYISGLLSLSVNTVSQTTVAMHALLWHRNRGAMTLATTNATDISAVTMTNDSSVVAMTTNSLATTMATAEVADFLYPGVREPRAFDDWYVHVATIT